ncbi:MAG: TetR/AcrR family transcriptional regulator [Alphaproteobacteria bacterium]
MNSQNKRERLIESAAQLFHHNGLNSTSLADIAKHADIPIGNVYYYFKAKDDLAIAAIDRRKEHFSLVYNALEEAFADPRQRLIEYLGYYDKMRDEYYTYGCPIGRIINESRIEKDSVAQAASDVFDAFLMWAMEQFRALGHSPEDAKKHAICMMAGIQGGVVMARAFSNPQILSDELQRISQWLESLPNRKISLGKAGLRASAEA